MQEAETGSGALLGASRHENLKTAISVVGGKKHFIRKCFWLVSAEWLGDSESSLGRELAEQHGVEIKKINPGEEDARELYLFKSSFIFLGEIQFSRAKNMGARQVTGSSSDGLRVMFRSRCLRESGDLVQNELPK